MNSLIKVETWHAATDADTEGSWNNHGFPLVYSNWATAGSVQQPDNARGAQDCAVINGGIGSWGGIGQWDDEQCEKNTYGYVCELGIYAQRFRQIKNFL